MSDLSYQAIQRHYAEAMHFTGMEAMARLDIADRLAAAAREAVIVEARRSTPRVHPLVLSVGGTLVRLGERLEAIGRTERRKEYA